MESIKYFYQIIVLGIKDGDLGGFRSMAVYVWSKEDAIQREILQEYFRNFCTAPPSGYFKFS